MAFHLQYLQLIIHLLIHESKITIFLTNLKNYLTQPSFAKGIELIVPFAWAKVVEIKTKNIKAKICFILCKFLTINNNTSNITKFIKIISISKLNCYLLHIVSFTEPKQM